MTRAASNHACWRTAMSALDHGVVIVDRDSRITAANAAAERLLGRADGELQGRRADELGDGLIGPNGARLERDGVTSVAALGAPAARRRAGARARFELNSARTPG